MRGTLRRFARQVVPAGLAARVRTVRWRLLRREVSATGLAGFEPISAVWGLDRGTPLDHYYIERYLASHAIDIRGRVMEVGSSRYSIRFGGSRVARIEVLNYTAGHPEATLVGDLVSGRGIPSDTFDCLIVTNTLRLVTDLRAAIATCHRALRQGGVLLAHFTGITPNSLDDRSGPPGWYGEGDAWRVTEAQAVRLCAEHFGDENVEVHADGNLRVAAAFLYALAAEDLTREELDRRDRRYDVVIMVRATKR